jgi:hypothetical protein
VNTGIPLAAASVSQCLLSGPIAALCKHFHDDGVAAVLAPGFAPKRDWWPIGEPHVTCGAVVSSEIGEEQVPGHPLVETHIAARAGMRGSADS